MNAPIDGNPSERVISELDDAPTRENDTNKADWSLQLRIDPVITAAEEIAELIRVQLPTHSGLLRISRCVAKVARDAKDVSRRLKRPIGLHRLPAIFLTLSVAIFAVWFYWQFLHTSELTIAVPNRDAVELRESIAHGRVRFALRETEGSRENIELLEAGAVDLAFIQGGVPFSDDLPRTQLPQSEMVLFFLRKDLNSVSSIRKILTSNLGQGSHSLAEVFTSAWKIGDQVSYVHDWRVFTDDKNYVISPDIDAVFVVKDPMNQSLDGVVARLEDAGYALSSPELGTLRLRLDYLEDTFIRPGYLDPVRNLPSHAVATYSVANYLVARNGLTPHQLSVARTLFQPKRDFPDYVEPSLAGASEVAQGLEAILGTVIYIGLAFLALLGLDMVAYRKRFHELNTLVSLISMHQSSKDVIAGSPTEKAHSVLYLRQCSDLLGIISVITGYYTQENSSLMYNRLSDVIHERCDGLKINIQLKILHAQLDLPADSPSSNGAPDVSV